MKNKEKIVKHYFESWIKKDISVIEKHFSQNVKYIECYDPEYNGINQIRQWFNDWNKGNNVLRWDVKEFIENGNLITVEWFFKCEYDNTISGFDGVSIIEFDDDNKIVLVKEFQSKAEHTHPYDGM